MANYLALPLLLCALVACVAKPEQVKESHVQEDVPKKNSCEIPSEAEALNDPKSIAEAVELINALPKPLDLDCFLRALKRPLYVNATSSTISVQPADGVENPRIFIFKDTFIISFVPYGSGSHLIEFSELKSNIRSIKGELKLPIQADVSHSAPYANTITTGQTSCSGCHKGEQVEEGRVIEGVQVYSSYAIRPTPSKDVPLDDLNQQLYLCNFNKEDTFRCRVYEALLGPGDVYPQNFPDGMFTFLQSIQN